MRNNGDIRKERQEKGDGLQPNIIGVGAHASRSFGTPAVGLPPPNHRLGLRPRQRHIKLHEYKSRIEY